MGAIFGGLFSLLGGAVNGFFGLKQTQGVVIQEGIKSVGSIVASEGERESAQSNSISAEVSSGYWMAAIWRPLTMMVFLGIIVSYWFGYVPPGLMAEKMPPMIDRLFGLLEIGLGGYIGGRTLEKIFASLGLGSAVKNYVSKKLA